MTFQSLSTLRLRSVGLDRRGLWRPNRRPDAWAQAKRALRREALVIAAPIALALIAAGVQVYAAGASSWPLALAAWLGAGVITGLLLAAARELLRDAIDVRTVHKLASVVGSAPEVFAPAMRQLPPDKRTPFGMITLQPSSALASAARTLQHAWPNQSVVAFLGPLPEDGATTSALCVAVSAALQGRRTIAIDCDIRRRALTRELGLTPGKGVLEACESPEDWRALIEEEAETGLHVLPAARPSNIWRSLLGAGGMPELIGHLREEYDLVVLDCPPASTAEGLALAGMAQSGIVVAAWNQTPVSAVRGTTRRLRARLRNVGVYLNRLPRRIRLTSSNR